MIDMTRHIRESNLIEEVDDPREDLQSMLAWRYLNDSCTDLGDLTHNVICTVQRLITVHHLDPPQLGNYRCAINPVNVSVGRHIAPGWPLVEHLMDNWLLDYAALAPFEAHIRFETIHPFVDGNGRTGRMLLWWQEIQNGEEPTLIEARNRHRYYDRLTKGRSSVG